jgi:hypothetical protein
MKVMILLFLFMPFIHSQNDSSIYFENFEAVEFEAKNDLRTLTFTINREKGLNKIVIIKQEEDSYVFATISKEGESETLVISKKTVKWMMPTLVKNYTDRYKVSEETIYKIVDLIY